MTLYLGAGGGGDTNSAILRALCDNTSDKKYVLGAGYGIADYKKSLKDGVKKRVFSDNEQIYDRLPWPITEGSPSIDNYLDSVLEKQFENIYIPTEVYKLKNGEKFNKEFFIQLDTGGNPTSFAYRALFEEVKLLNDFEKDLKKKNMYDNIYMFFSIDNFEDNDQTKKLYNSLKVFIQQMIIKKIYLMDFGADIFDFKKLARDTAVLLVIAKILKELNDPSIQLIIDVYGPGVDAHAPINEVLQNLNNVKPTSSNITFSEMKPFMNILFKNLDKLEIMKPGRATGNYYQAYSLCNKNNVDGDNYINNYIKKRHDFLALLTDDEQKAVVSQAENVLTEKGICEFAKAFRYTIDSSNIDEFMMYLNKLSVANKSLKILENAILKSQLQIAGAKPKNLKKTKDKFKIKKRDAVVYVTPRGVKYIIIKGNYIKLKDISKALEK